MERPANDRRPPKPKCGPSLMIQNNFPAPQTCPDYIAMPTAAETTKQPLKEVRGILPEKKKTPHGWPASLKKTPPKVGFQNNNIYVVHTSDEEHHYEEPKEKEESQGMKELQEKNIYIFYKLKINDDVDLSNVPHEEEYTDEHYESIKEWETTV